MLPTKGYSTRVSIHLKIGGFCLPVSHAGHSGLRLATHEGSIPFGDALLIVDVDGKKKQKRIVVTDGFPDEAGFIRFI